jgi:predicted nucleotide-binding protein (sugar kinase/HSP70/actin superfamily)
VPAFEKQIDRFLSPTVMFRDGPEAVTAALGEYCRRLDIAPARVARCVAAAYQAQGDFRLRLLAAGKKALATLCESGAPGIVIIGRPYNVHDAGVNLSVARKLRDFYGVNCLPLDCLDLDNLDIQDINANMFWDYGRKLLAAAKLVSGHDNLHIIHITNFKCGPDSFIKHFLRSASAGKPLLSLQFDGHSNDAGMMTRCEAYLDSKGILRPWKKKAIEDAMVPVS